MEEELRKTIRRFMNEITDNIALGSAKSFEEYNRMVGQIECLAIAERELLSLQQNFQQSEDF